MNQVQTYHPRDIKRAVAQRRKRDELRCAGGLSLTASVSLGALSGGAAAWTPAQFGADLLAWYDASDASTITLDGSSNVSELRDKGPGGRHLGQAAAGNRPPLTTWRGLSAIDFNTHSLVTAAFSAVAVGPMLIAWSAGWDEISSDSMLLSMDATNDFSIDFFTTGFLPYMGGMGLDSYWQLGGASSQLDHYADFLTSTSSAAGTRLHWNGSEKTKNSGTHIQSVQNVTRFGLGYAIATGANTWIGQFGEIMIVNGASATAENAALLREYLRAKRGF